jgi:type IV pilus assembly protein PilB
VPFRLGELLLKEDMVTPLQLQAALDRQRMKGGTLREAFVSLGLVEDGQITGLLSRLYGVPLVELDHLEIDPAATKVIPAETARKYQILPVSVSGKTLTVAMTDPTNVFAMDDIRFMTGYNLQPVVASETALEAAVDRCYGPSRAAGTRTEVPPRDGPVFKEVSTGRTLGVDDLAAIGALSEIDLDSIGEAETDITALKSEENEIDLGNLAKSAHAPQVVKLTNVLLVDALKRGASDIHIEPYEKEFRVRLRIDGVLYNLMALPLRLRGPLADRIKSMARMDVMKRRVPQMGRIKILMKVEDRRRELVFRVSCLPTAWGETIVMRLLDNPNLLLDVTRLGFEPQSLDRLKRAIATRRGLVLFAGPAGCGKTSTLTAAITLVDRSWVNIVSVSTFREFDIPGVNHVAIQREGGHDLEEVMLRQDVNVLLFDQILDDGWAKSAVGAAASSGHLVLATVNEMESSSAVERLAEAGVQALTLARALRLVVAQRLVRRVCPACTVDDTANVASKVLVDVGFNPEEIGTFRLTKGEGCRACNGTGYKGRVGLFEAMEVSEAIADRIMVGSTASDIKRKAREEGMLTLRMSGLEKIKNGVTTIEEVLRETTR